MLSSVERDQLQRWANGPAPSYPIVFNAELSKYGWSFGSYSTTPVFDTRGEAVSAFERYIAGLRRYGAQQNSTLIGVASTRRRIGVDEARFA